MIDVAGFTHLAEKPSSVLAAMRADIGSLMHVHGATVNRLRIRISGHAVERYRERVRQVDPAIAKREMLCCLMGASDDDRRKLKKGKKNTHMIKTGCCIFICSHGNVVTVVKKYEREDAKP